MNNIDAKLILQAYRPNDQDAQDPFFQKALAQADQDSSLAEWFASERAHDAAIAQKLSEIPVPPNLKSSILLGKKMIHRRSFFTRPAFLALAACMVIGLFTTAYLQMPRIVPFEHYENEIARFTSTHHFNPIFKNAELPKIREWLNQNEGSPSFTLTDNLDKLAEIGCQVHKFHGQKVSVICFWVNKDKYEAIHLFVVDRDALTNPPAAPILNHHGRVATASWSDSRHTYILVGIGDENYIAKYL